MKEYSTIPSGPVKSGWRTTEFVLTIVSMTLGYLVTTGKLTAESKTMLADAAEKIAGAVMAVVPLWKYIHSRMVVKSQ